MCKKTQDLFEILKHLCVKTAQTALSALASVPTVGAICPAVVEDCRDSYEEKTLMQCGHTA